MQKKRVALQASDWRLQIGVPAKSLSSRVVACPVQEACELDITFHLLADHEACSWEGTSIVDVRSLSHPDPLSEDVTEADDPRTLLMLSIFELRQQVIFVCLLHLLQLTKHILEELLFALGRDD